MNIQQQYRMSRSEVWFNHMKLFIHFLREWISFLLGVDSKEMCNLTKIELNTITTWTEWSSHVWLKSQLNLGKIMQFWWNVCLLLSVHVRMKSNKQSMKTHKLTRSSSAQLKLEVDICLWVLSNLIYKIFFLMFLWWKH